MEKHLEQFQRLESIGNLAGGIAHDFNNILSSIIGFTELAMADADRNTMMFEYLKEVYTAGIRAKDLVKQILTFARQTDEQVKPVQPAKIVDEVLAFIKSSVPSSIEIRKVISSGDSFVMGNKSKIYQMLMNLCVNASQAMEEEGGTLEVSLKDGLTDWAS